LLVVVLAPVAKRKEIRKEMSIKSKVLSAIANHPKLIVFGIGLAVTFVITLTTGLTSPENAFAAGARCKIVKRR
jgi:hypothetical protein